MRSHRVEAWAQAIVSMLEERPDIALHELRRTPASSGLDAGMAEQERPDIAARSRQAWSSQKLDCESLIFMDETWAKTSMARTHGRSGQRLHMGLSHGHRKTTMLVAGIKTTGLSAPMGLDGPLTGD